MICCHILQVCGNPNNLFQVAFTCLSQAEPFQPKECNAVVRTQLGCWHGQGS